MRQAVGQPLGVLLVEHARLGGRGQRVEGARGAQRRVLAGVLQLEQLDRPLDVGEPPATELEVGVRVGAARQPLRVDPGLDPADLDHVVPAHPVGRVAQRVDHLGEPAPAGPRRRRPRRPAAAPAPPRPSTTSRSTRRTTRGVRTSGPCLPSGRRSASTSSAGSPPGRESSRRSSLATAWAYVAASCSSAPVHRVVHEHHVGVAAVGQLEAAVPAHRDDRHPGRRLVEPLLLADRALGDVERRLEGRVGQPGQAGAHVGDVDLAEQVADRDPEQLAAPDPADRRAPRPPRRLLAPGGGNHLAGQRLGGQRGQVLAEHPHALRLALEQVGRVARGGQHPGQPLAPPAPRRAAC